MRTSEYIEYLSNPFQNKAIMILATLNGVLLGFIEDSIGISLGILSIYFILAVIDTVIGIYKNVIVLGKEFKSELFLKKLLSMGIMAISVSAMTQLAAHVESIVVPFNQVNAVQNSIVYIFNMVKIFLTISFISYELTSLRENAVILKWGRIVEVTDIVLTPLTWIKILLRKKINKDELDS